MTGDGSVAALEAAHLVPAKNGENDMPCNGIALRADLHRLFDAGLFTFDERGQVLVADRGKGLSPAYRRLLRGARLPPRTLDRVGVTLALPQFHERQAPRRL
ncbi:MAG: HNH endonuclease [Gammaproteobacteria bacterium]|nr:HNH endonuclease [Gammaproteobacteria bacterium]